MQFLRTAWGNITLARLLPLICTVLYTVVAGAYFFSIGNTEFLGYVLILILAVLIGGCVLAHQCVPAWLLWLLASIGLLHILGDAIIIEGDVLYNYVPFYIENPAGLTFIKFDQIVHTYASGVMAVLSYFFLKSKEGFRSLGLFIFSVLAAMGFGAVNEILEFSAKLTVPDNNVGGYYNTAVDLTVNLIGSVIGALLAVVWWRRG